jgi:hypothetical protein
MSSGVSRNVVKTDLIRLGSCRSAIELRPQTIDLIHFSISDRLSIPAKSLPTLHRSEPSDLFIARSSTAFKPFTACRGCG